MWLLLEINNVQNKRFSFSYAITNSAANALNPPTLTGGVGIPETKTYVILSKIRIVNKTAGAVTVTAYIGLTGASTAGTEWTWNATSVPANGAIEWQGQRYMKTADFLVMLAGANTSLVANVEGEIGLAD